MKRSNAVVIGLLGAIVGLLLVVTVQFHATPGAQGQGSSTSGVSAEWLMGTTTAAGGRAACFIFNTKDVMLGMYTSTGRAFNLDGMRLCTLDFQLLQYPKTMRPSLKDVQEMLKKQKRP